MTESSDQKPSLSDIFPQEDPRIVKLFEETVRTDAFDMGSYDIQVGDQKVRLAYLKSDNVLDPEVEETHGRGKVIITAQPDTPQSNLDQLVDHFSSQGVLVEVVKSEK